MVFIKEPFLDSISTSHHINMYLVYGGLLLILVVTSLLNIFIIKKYGEKYTKSVLQFPFVFLASLFVFFAIGKIGYTTSRNEEKYDKSLGIELSKFTQQVVVDRWEKDVSKNVNLYQMYKDIFSKPSNSVNKNGFYTIYQWEKKFPDVPYVPYEGNEDSWHFAAQYIQEQLNIYRMFHLADKFKVGNENDLKKSQEGIFAGWISCFRMFFTNPTIRNVWEQYKYRHGNPLYSAWVKYYVTDVIEKPGFFKNHQEKWDKESVEILKKKKKEFKEKNKKGKFF